MKVFDCSAFRFLEVRVKKLDSKSVKEIFVSFGHNHDSYYLYNPVSGKISHSRKVSFNEKEFIGLQNIEPEDYEFLTESETALDFEESEAKPLKPLKPVVENFDSPTQESLPNQNSSRSNSYEDTYAEFRTRSGGHVETVERYGCPINHSESVSFLNVFLARKLPPLLRKLKCLSFEMSGLQQ